MHRNLWRRWEKQAGLISLCWFYYFLWILVSNNWGSALISRLSQVLISKPAAKLLSAHALPLLTQCSLCLEPPRSLSGMNLCLPVMGENLLLLVLLGSRTSVVPLCLIQTVDKRNQNIGWVNLLQNSSLLVALKMHKAFIFFPHGSWPWLPRVLNERGLPWTPWHQ